MSRYFRIKLGIALISLFIAGVLFWTFITFLISPFYKKEKDKSYSEVFGFADVVEEMPSKLHIKLIRKDAYFKLNEVEDVWVIKHSDKSITVFSPICTHLGCRYNWEKKAKNFVCPCHASIFTIEGKVVAGPAPRPLDTLPYEIKDEKLYVEWLRYKAGVAEKIVIGSEA